MAECIDDVEVHVIKRRQLIEGLLSFPRIKDHMTGIAREKKEYHKVLINSIVTRYSDPVEARTLIDNRMQDEQITTHMSLKLGLKKNKATSKAVMGKSQVIQQRILNSADFPPEEGEMYPVAEGGDADAEDQASDRSITMTKKERAAYKDAAVIDVMRDKASAVIGSYTIEMK